MRRRWLAIVTAPRAGDLAGTLSLAGRMRAPFAVDEATIEANTAA